ncbi:hypothetical protein BDW67DRAFT_185489 [Aspergillus spinulosporus]
MSAHPTKTQISGLSERISTLEQAISNPQSGAPSVPRPVPDRREQDHSAEDTPASHLARPRAWDPKTAGDDRTAHRAREPPAPAKDTSMQPACEARHFLQQELRRSDHLSLHRRTVLENALLLVNKLSTATLEPKQLLGSARSSEDRDPPDLHAFSIETYYMMSKHMVHQHSPGKHLHWPDHVSIKGLEHMSLSLVEGNLAKQTELYYRVCVYVKAIFFYARIRQPQLTPRLRSHIKTTHEKYTAAALKALEQISFVEDPSISLVQALLSGALLHQMLGNITKAWNLTSFAAQLLVAMNYHTISPDTPIQSQEDEDARYCLFSCHYLDKSLSMHLLRPPSLPRLRVSPASLVPMEGEAALGVIAKTVVELAEIQEAALEIIHARSVLVGNVDETAAKLDAVIQQLVSLKIVIDERCLNSQQDMPLEWVGIEFRYHAVMTTLLQYHLEWQEKSEKREECLQSARQALEALRRLQKIANTDTVSIGSYPIFLSWTVLFYPMAPFYILFCNVVGTSNLEDYQLLRDITKGLYRFIDYNPASARLYHLFTTFLNLCNPLVVNQPSPLANQNGTNMTETPTIAAPGIPSVDPNNHSYGESSATDIQPDMASWWNSIQMWELISTQPSLQWVDSENTNVNEFF